MFRESKLNKDEDPDVWITNLEDLRIKLEVMVSSMTDEQFMIQILNSLKEEYELQMLLLEKRIVDVNNPLTIEELKEELTLRFERMTSKTDSAKGKGSFDEKALFMGYFKGKCRNCGKLGHKASQCKSRQIEETKNEVICNYCKKSGHVKANCFKLLKKNQSQGENNVSGLRNGVATTMTDVAFTSIENSKDLDKEIRIGDSGASSHYCNDDKGLFDYKIISEEITVGNGDAMIAEKVGKLQCYVEQDDGGKVPIVLEGVKYIPNLWINLFSICKALKGGSKIGNIDEIITLTKNDVILKFDTLIKTKDGCVPGIKLTPIVNDIGASAMRLEKGERMDINNLHKILGHCGEASARLTGKALGYEVTGKFEVCEPCAIGKARQKNVNKDWKGGSNTPGERLYVDISSIKGKSFGGATFWALIVDDFSGYCWSYFLKRKDELSSSVIGLIQELRNDHIFVRTLRLDDAGENYALEKACKHEKLCIKFGKINLF